MKLIKILLEEEDYRGHHRAPGKEGGYPLHDLTEVFPDFYDLPARLVARYYGSGYPFDIKMINLIQSLKDKPDAIVTIYRTVPKAIGGDINPGDWVSISKEYAIQHGVSHVDNNYAILSKNVKASEVFTEGYLEEWGYDPS